MPRDANGRCPAPDLVVDAERVQRTLMVRSRAFDATSCELYEHCIDAPGTRTLLAFDTRTPNLGSADVYLGAPSLDNPVFEYSSCHMHFHFVGYALYELRRMDGTVVARGHKQGFCLEDEDRASVPDDSGAPYYVCALQGIQSGWADVYDTTVACQWVDVTDVSPGNYLLHVTVDPARAIPESSYDNNEVDVTVTLP
jgi:hypothetical protein